MIQSHFVDLESVVVAPMETDKPTSGVDIAVEHGDGEFVLALSELGAVERPSLGRPLGSLRDLEDDIRRALDKLFSGF
jgi:toxin CcdB